MIPAAECGSKTVQFGDAGRVELLVDVLNLLNDTAEEALVSEPGGRAVIKKVAQ